MNTRSNLSTWWRWLLITVAVVVTAAVLLLTPRVANAFTLVAPTEGQQVPWMQVRPVVAYDLATGEVPKYALLAQDKAMTKTERYCRQWGSAWIGSSWHWGCDAWAVGTDSTGQDIIRPLEDGNKYWLTFTYTDANGKDQTTKPIWFFVQAAPTFEDPSSISDQVMGSVVGDGTNLNLGAAAYVNSKLKVTNIRADRLSTYSLQVSIGYNGGVDLSRSYVKVTSKAGHHYIPLRQVGSGAARAMWTLTGPERKLKRRIFSYQAFLKSTKNGAFVKSVVRVIIVKRRPHVTPVSN
jgi:hypothetical protein